jgi:phosphate-selective porin OprO and OprP
LDRRVRRGIAVVALACAPSFVDAAIPIYRNGSDFKLDLGIRVQLQYYHLGDDDWSEQKLYFRRLRPALEATFSPSWGAEAEFDFGETIEGEEVEFKDILVSYLGFEPKGFLITLGNEKAVFSRQLQSSSKSLTLIERGSVGVDDFGSLDRVLGARVDGRDSSERLTMAASFGLASHQPDASQMEFESPLNAGEDANRGWSLSGRVELQPLGEVDYDQGDFGREHLRFALAASAYRWSNDGSRNPYTENGRATREDAADLDRSHGLEVSGALRGRGLSADAEIQWVRGETTDRAFTGGLYDRGETELTKLSLQSGYMVLPERVEVVGGYDRLEAATYASAWKRISLGATYYWKRQQLKLQCNYVLHRSFFGAAGDDPRAIVTQLQILF